MVRSSTDIELLRRSQLLNSCLLVIGLLMAAAVIAGVGLGRGDWRLGDLTLLPALALLLGGGWLLAAYLFSRVRRYTVAGSLVIAFVLLALALAIYLLPGYTLALLPFACIPVALAALLLSRPAVYLATLATLGALAGAAALAGELPPPALALGLPPPGAALSAASGAVALGFLALILAPLRGELARLLGQLQHGEAAALAAADDRLAAELARDAAQADLEERERNFDTVLQHVSDGVIAINPAGKVVRANATARELWVEITGGDLIGQRFDQLRATLMGPTAPTQFVDIVELPRDEAAGGEGYTHVLLDRRERARLTRLRGELLSLLADEMRNPLTSMVTALEMTLGQNLPEGADRVLVGARRSGQRLLELVTTMLEINQLEHNPNALRRAPLPLRPILDAGIAQTTPLQHQGAVQVVVEYSGDGLVLIDGERVRRAFVHLLEHALRQSPPYSTVQVRTECQSDVMAVRISDQGPGLTPQQRELLFDQRVMPDERKAPALGLAFSKLVVETHGGRVMVESSGSHGSTYLFTLPLAPRDVL